jgi:hypothetical protein
MEPTIGTSNVSAVLLEPNVNILTVIRRVLVLERELDVVNSIIPDV